MVIMKAVLCQVKGSHIQGHSWGQQCDVALSDLSIGVAYRPTNNLSWIAGECDYCSLGALKNSEHSEEGNEWGGN